jgi:hypothetical protein
MVTAGSAYHVTRVARLRRGEAGGIDLKPFSPCRHASEAATRAYFELVGAILTTSRSSSRTGSRLSMISTEAYAAEDGSVMIKRKQRPMGRMKPKD